MSNEREQLIARLRRFAVVLEARGETYDAETCEQAIASLSAPPAGYVLVPREPTGRMLADGWNASIRELSGVPAANACYRAMLDAENLARGNVIGRIAAHLLGQQNNVTDEEVVVAAARIGGELLGANTRAKRAEDDLMAAHNAVAQMMIRQSIATGHGDTVADMVAELEPTVAALRKVAHAYETLRSEAEEWECDGLGLFAQHGWWEPVDEALDALTKGTP